MVIVFRLERDAELGSANLLLRYLIDDLHVS